MGCGYGDNRVLATGSRALAQEDGHLAEGRVELGRGGETEQDDMHTL